MKYLLFILPLFASLCSAQQRISVVTDTNGVLLTPTNFFATNVALENVALNSYQTNRDYFWRTNAAAIGGISNLFAPLSVFGNETNVGHLAVTGTVQVAGTVIATNYTGVVGLLTNGSWRGAALINGVNSGNAFSSPGGGFFSEQFGLGAAANGAGALAVGKNALGQGVTSAAVGNAANAVGDNSTAVGVTANAYGYNSTAVGNGTTVATNHPNSTALGYGAVTTASNQTMIGSSGISTFVNNDFQAIGNTINAHFMGTNTYALGADVGFARRTITTLANGNNSGVSLTTNVFFELSGPSGAFTNCGFVAGYDGKWVVLVYQGGQPWYIANESGNDSAAANRIRTGTGADLLIPGNPGWAMMFYSASAQRWLLYLPAQQVVSSAGSFSSLNVGTLTLTNQLASTNISHTYVRTNFVSGVLYTNLYGGPIEVSAMATLGVAAVSGNSVLALEMSGNDTNQVGMSTLVTSIAMTYTNVILGVVTNNGTYTFTNRSSGAGNTASVANGQIIVY